MLRSSTHAPCYVLLSRILSPLPVVEQRITTVLRLYNLSRRNVSSVAESVTKFGSVSICRPSKSRGSRPSLRTSSDGKRSESKLSGMPTIALPMSLTKSWRDSVSSAPETSVQAVYDPHKHQIQHSRGETACRLPLKQVKGKGNSYVLYSAVSSALATQSALYFSPGRRVHFSTNSTSLGSILATQRLHANWSIMKISQMPKRRNGSKGDSNQGSLDLDLKQAYKWLMIRTNMEFHSLQQRS